MTKTTGSPPRISWIDSAKGVGIILVVVGHVLSGTPHDIIFLFHMPLFFIISGYTFKPKTMADFSKSKARSLLVPYVSFLLIVSFVDAVAAHLQGTPPVIDIARPLVSLSRLVLGGSTLFGSLGAFWFLTCLFLAMCTFNFICSCANLNYFSAPAIILTLAAASYTISLAWPNHIPTPLGLGVAPLAVFFIWVGSLSSRIPNTRKAQINITLTSTVVFCVGAFFAPKFDMKPLVLGNPLINIPVAIAGSLLTIQISRSLEKFAALRAPIQLLGRCSLTIMCTHLLIILHTPMLPASVKILGSLALGTALHLAVEKSPVLSRFLLGSTKKAGPSKI